MLLCTNHCESRMTSDADKPKDSAVDHEESMEEERQ